MYLNINIREPVGRLRESDFIVQALVDVLAPGDFPAEEQAALADGMEPLEEEFVVGRIWAERLDWSYAEQCGYEVSVICDEASGTWNQVLETLSRNGGRSFRPELNIHDVVQDIVFVHETLMHPEVPDRIAIIAAALQGISGDNSLLMMYHEQSESYHLDGWECRDLGFKKIARSNLLIRDNHFRYPFSDATPEGRDVEFAATAEHEAWLLEQWEKLIVDHPSL